jgi:hypothetical protein
MEISHEKTACIGYGFSTLADAFQAGREAAQMAKSQTPDSPANLALAVGPADIHFKDFIEGARLVTGGNALVGIPAPWVFSTGAPNARSRAVLLLQTETQRINVVSSPEEPSPLVTVTSLLTDLRTRRGNARLDHDFHGLIALDNNTLTPRSVMSHHLAADAGLESWIAGVALWPGANAPMICGSQVVAHGVTVIECLSNGPWGVGWVDTSALSPDPSLRLEAARTSIREALVQLQSRKPCAGLLLVVSESRAIPEDEARLIFAAASGVLSNVPLIGIPVRSPFLRAHGRTISDASEGIISLLVPQ